MFWCLRTHIDDRTADQKRLHAAFASLNTWTRYLATSLVRRSADLSKRRNQLAHPLLDRDDLERCVSYFFSVESAEVIEQVQVAARDLIGKRCIRQGGIEAYAFVKRA